MGIITHLKEIAEESGHDWDAMQVTTGETKHTYKGREFSVFYREESTNWEAWGKGIGTAYPGYGGGEDEAREAMEKKIDGLPVE